MEADQVRLFRNHPEIRWQHRVHEQIIRSIERIGGRLQKSDIVIDHAGYVDSDLARKKTERNLRLLELERAERPDDAFTLFNLGWAYHELGQTAEALGVWQRSLERVERGAAIERKLFALLAQGHFRLGDWHEALAASRAGQDRYPADVELLFEESVALYQLGDLAGAEMALLRLLQQPQGNHVVMTDASLRGEKARNNLGLIYLQQRRWEDAEEQWRLLVAEFPERGQAWAGLAEALLGQRRFGDLEECIARLDNEAHRVILRARARLVQREFSEARQLLESAIAASPEAVLPRVLFSHALLQVGRDWIAAERALRDILAIDPANAEAARNLAVLLRQQGRE
jgi:tetratricopeptide (TPR) repeat protein